MYVIGLTGGIACGKSTVSQRLKEKHGAVILDTDRIAWEMAAPQQPLWRSYVERYGSERATLADGTLDRAAIGEIVFADPAERAWVDGMAHPLIKSEVHQRLKQHQAQGALVAVLDVPLLFEAGWQTMADEIWVVYADEATQLQRLMERNEMPEVLARQRVASQMPLAEKKRRADVIIDNSGALAEAMRQVDAAWEALMRQRTGRK